MNACQQTAARDCCRQYWSESKKPESVRPHHLKRPQGGLRNALPHLRFSPLTGTKQATANYFGHTFA